MKEVAGEQGTNDGDENAADVAAEAASAAAREAEIAAALAEAAVVKLRLNQERSKRAAEEAAKAAATAAGFRRHLHSTAKSAGSLGEAASRARTAASVKASKDAAAQAKRAAKRAQDACKRKGLDPADLGFRGPQWIVLITTMLGAIITVALLAVTSNLFSTTQANVARKGFENFQSVDPLKVCISPPGNEENRIRRCSSLTWACEQQCTILATNSNSNSNSNSSSSSNLTSTQPVPIWFVWDWEHNYRALLDILGAPACSFIESFSFTLEDPSVWQPFPVSWDNGRVAAQDRAIWETQTRLYSEVDFKKGGREVLDGTGDNPYLGLILNTFAEKVDFAVLSTNGSQYDALNGTFFVRDSSAISYGNTLVPPLRKAVTDWLTDPQHQRNVSENSGPFPPASVAVAGLHGTLSLLTAHESNPEPQFLRLRLRRAVDISAAADGACMQQVKAALSLTGRLGLGRPKTLYPSIALNGLLDEAWINGSLGLGTNPIDTRNTTCQGRRLVDFITKEDVASSEDTLGLRPDRPIPVQMSPGFNLSIQECSRIALTARYCIPQEDCSPETNVTVDNLALLNSFVEAAKKDRNVGSSIFAGWRMTYDDLNGLYIGLLAGAVSSCALALTAVVGLAIAYILDYWG